jgi:hypothetical protein
MNFSPDCIHVDILGGSKGTVLAWASFSSGVHAWEIKVVIFYILRRFLFSKKQSADREPCGVGL